MAIHELRIYHCEPARKPEVMKRFDDVLLGLWKEYEVELVGMWTVLVGPDSATDVYYMLSWSSLEERETKFNRIRADKRWADCRRETEANGPLIRSFSNLLLEPVDTSNAKSV